jgi:hypothetical protein
MTYPMTDDWYTVLPPPDALSFGGFMPGESPYALLTYKLSDPDNAEALEDLFGPVFVEAKNASTDGTVKVRVQ